MLLNCTQIGALDTVESELKAFRDTIMKSESFASYLANPTIARGVKVDSVRTAFLQKQISPLHSFSF